MENNDTEEKGAPDAQSSGSETQPPKKGFEEKLDEIADRFSKTMGDGIKHMESTFERITNNPDFAGHRVKGFFQSHTGGAVLIVIGVVWLFYALGLLGKPILPVIAIVIGIYLMRKYKS